MKLFLGLDPTGPLFENHDSKVGLYKDCATFVDVMHTQGIDPIVHLGTMKVLGHMDFYPNGGGYQPGCTGRRNSKQHCQLSYYNIKVIIFIYWETIRLYDILDLIECTRGKYWFLF